MSDIEYKPKDFISGEDTVYVYFKDFKIGWIAARKEYEIGKVYFCFNPKRKPNPKFGQLDSISGQTHIFDNLTKMEDWIKNKMKQIDF
jgi:hypothetical protein